MEFRFLLLGLPVRPSKEALQPRDAVFAGHANGFAVLCSRVRSPCSSMSAAYFQCNSTICTGDEWRGQAELYQTWKQRAKSQWQRQCIYDHDFKSKQCPETIIAHSPLLHLLSTPCCDNCSLRQCEHQIGQMNSFSEVREYFCATVLLHPFILHPWLIPRNDGTPSIRSTSRI